jgi:hypothetical protein
LCGRASGASRDIEHALEAISHGRGGADVGMELHKLVDYLGGCEQVALLLGLVP